MKFWSCAILSIGISVGVSGQAQTGTRQVAGRLRHVAAMSDARAAHTATALANGNILVVGGFGQGESQLAGAEVFDVSSQQFVATGQPITRRQSHTATRLRDGSVLIVGGLTPNGTYDAGAELYDPQTATFRAAGSMSVGRAGHEAVLLRDGRVLIVGGIGSGWTFLASAEIYSPETGRFTATGSMGEPRESHVALALNDGRVLVAGGHHGRGAAVVISQSAEIYDAATGTFTATGPMGLRRHKHDGVTLTDGTVLIIGGADERDNKGVYSSVETFDPASGRFSPGTSTAEPRYKHRHTTVVLPGGRLLLAGGAPFAEEFEPHSGRTSPVAAEGRLRGQFSAAALMGDGSVLICGGYGEGSGPGRDAWIFTPAAATPAH